jgi:hypothetical protein
VPLTAKKLQAADIVEVVGESYRQDALRRVEVTASNSWPFLDDLTGYARRRAEEDLEGRWFQALLVREPDNPADANAVAVQADGVGAVGYLSRDNAIAYAPVFDALARHGFDAGLCPAFLVGGSRPGQSLGVLLCLSSSEEVVRELEGASASPD